MSFIKQVEIRWSDLDPNFHVRHSAYYDFGAYCRIAFFNEHGITPEVMMQHTIGPVLFREECFFKKEISFEDKISIDLRLQRVSGDFRKWTMCHDIWKNSETLAAILTIEGAWMNTQLRKITAPPEIFRNAFELFPKTEDFKYL
jgi:acyl-CoA thioester hydrolase